MLSTWCDETLAGKSAIIRKDVRVGDTLCVRNTIRTRDLVVDGRPVGVLSDVCFNGALRNFPNGADTTRYAEFGGNTGTTTKNAILVPFDAIVIALSINYVHPGGGPVDLDPGDRLDVQAGLFAPPPSDPGAFAPFADTLLQITPADDGTFPGKFVTAAPGTPDGLGVVPQGSRLAVCGTEVGSVTPTGADLIVCVTLRPTTPL